jgi:hypothetical protein
MTKVSVSHDSGLSEFVAFVGELELESNRVPVNFRARIDDTGEVQYEFEKMTLNSSTRFILDSHNNNTSKFALFTLTGSADNSIRVQSNDIIFTSMNSSFGAEDGDWIQPVGTSSIATFFRTLSTRSSLPSSTLRLRGFQGFYPLQVECELGSIAMSGPKTIDNPNLLSGALQLKATTVPDDLHDWREKADKLLDHVRRVMSFASTAILRAPVSEFYGEEELELTAHSQTAQASSSMRTVHYLNQQPIFEAAVASFFKPPIEVKNLFYAIEWFAMDATYNEVRLINAMTVLENLVDSNLGDLEDLILPRKEFEKTRKVLRKVLRSCIGKWSSDREELTKEIVDELNERLNDLNRRSILKKLGALIQLWGIPMDGIRLSQLKAAKHARDLIVHRGHYYDADVEESDTLWEHITVIKELVVRILFTTIAYRGPYISFVGGMHHANFPPAGKENSPAWHDH